MPSNPDVDGYYFLNKSKGVVLAEKAAIADSFFSRLKGLLGTESLPDGQGLYIVPCNQIHMFGMRYAIDVVFVDARMKVVGVAHSIKPGQASSKHPEARACLELPAGCALKTNTEVGDYLESGRGPYTTRTEV